MAMQFSPLPLGEREGPKPQAWEGEGTRLPYALPLASCPHPPVATRRAPPSPQVGEGLLKGVAR
jgi:hypothetical protein